jgi:ATP-dependent protease ClpP protease subunit
MNEDLLEENESDEETEDSSVTVFDTFINVSLKGDVCSRTIDPIVDLLINVNLSEDFSKVGVINLFIDTDGGDLNCAFKLIDIIRMSEIPIRTIGMGKVASAGLIIFMSGAERIFSENASILSHQATYNVSNFSIKVSDSSHQQEFKHIMSRILKTYIRYSGKDEKYIKKHLLKENDVYLSAEDAIVHGLADKMLPQGMEWLKTFGEPDSDFNLDEPKVV